MCSILSSKGQITIPVEIRNQLRLNVGDRLEFVILESNRVEMIPRRGGVKALKGVVKWSGGPVSLAEMDNAIVLEAGK